MPEGQFRFSVASLLLALLAGTVAGSLLAFACATAAAYFAPSLGISSMEGGQGYFAALVCLAAAIIGFVGGVIGTLYFRGIRGMRIFGGFALSIVGLLALTATGFGIWYWQQPHILNPNGMPPRLVFEIKPPSGAFSPDQLTAIRIALDTDQNSMDATLDDVQNSSESKNVISGSVELYYRTSSRLLVLRLPGDEVRLFRLALPGNPMGDRYNEWSDWHKADFQDHPGQGQPQQVTAEPDYLIRYRIESENE